MPPVRLKQNGLDKELREDVAALSPHRLPYADLPRPLRHGHQHDVHDADAAHQQRDAGNRPKEDDKGLRGLLQRLDRVHQAGDREVVLVGNAVAQAQDVADLLRRRVVDFLVRDLHVDTLDSDLSARGPLRPQAVVRRGDGHEDPVVQRADAGAALWSSAPRQPRRGGHRSGWCAQPGSEVQRAPPPFPTPAAPPARVGQGPPHRWLSPSSSS